MINLLLTALNISAGLIVFVHCVCRLSVRQWTLDQPELWAHAALAGGSVGIIFSPAFNYTQPVPVEIVFNMGVAVYFLAQTWRLRKMKRSGHRV